MCSEVVIPAQREHSVLFRFLKVMVRQTFKGCSKRHTEVILQLDLRYGNGAKTIEKEDLIIIEGELDASE